MRAPRIVAGTRLTGTETVSSIPQPASRSPSVTTVEPDSTLRLTLGPVFADNDTRIASVPAGSVPPPWQAVSPPLMYATAKLAGTPLAPATISGGRESTTPSATAVSASPAASASRTRSTDRGPAEALALFDRRCKDGPAVGVAGIFSSLTVVAGDDL